MCGWFGGCGWGGGWGGGWRRGWRRCGGWGCGDWW